MSKHWNPDEEVARWTGADRPSPGWKGPLPKGAVSGLLLVASFCLAVGLALYQFAGPRDVVEDEIARP